ncbi:hypothetical protein [Thermoactinospora rubra]|uniref:hypothetical protein n=1 Tax=Thermoactinospora rubra TaxID=1088767 RepID=UPI000A10F61A|nr:hypothetical protein [Thermoactinospora rubra]
MTTLLAKITRGQALDSGHAVWGATFPDAPAGGGVTAETLAELREEIEGVKHFVLDLPTDHPITVKYVYDLPGVSADALADAGAVVRQLRAAGLSEEDSVHLLQSA